MGEAGVKMQVNYRADKLSLVFEQNSTYYYLQNVIDRNFSNKIGRKNKIIIFPVEEEETQRRYLLKLVAKIYKKQNKEADEKEIKRLKNSFNHTIKLSLELKNQILPDLQISVRFDDTQAIIFSLENHNRLFVSYLKNYFKDHLLQYRMRTKTITIFPNSEQTLLRLQKLFSTREHMAWYASFEYDLNSYNVFCDYWFRKQRRKHRFKALNSIMEEYFEVLGCTSFDSYAKVRHRYLQLAKMYHPDRQSGKGTDVIACQTEKFEKVQIAYEILKAYFKDEIKSSASA